MAWGWPSGGRGARSSMHAVQASGDCSASSHGRRRDIARLGRRNEIGARAGMALSVDMRVAIVGATAALLGTIAGGGVTWWQTRDLQDREFAREDHVRAVAAGAAAAVEANRYDIARSAVDA